VRIFSSSGCSLGPTAPTESPFSCFDSGRVHPNPFFQQAYAFTHVQFLVLLLQRQDVADFSVEGIIFEADKSIVAQITGQPCRRRKIGFAAWAKTDNRQSG
jgi:hypothetical protein